MHVAYTGAVAGSPPDRRMREIKARTKTEFALINTYAFDFMLKCCGSYRRGLQGSVSSVAKPCNFDSAMKHRARLPEQDDLLRPRLVDMSNPRHEVRISRKKGGFSTRSSAAIPRLGQSGRLAQRVRRFQPGQVFWTLRRACACCRRQEPVGGRCGRGGRGWHLQGWGC